MQETKRDFLLCKLGWSYMIIEICCLLSVSSGRDATLDPFVLNTFDKC